jgi:MFS transporter, PPP family, 3-phenylpropionic acid transporter
MLSAVPDKATNATIDSDIVKRQALWLRVFYFFHFGALGALFPFLPLLFARRELRADQISWIMVLIPLASMTVPPLWGILADAFQARAKLLRIASVGSACSLFLLVPAKGVLQHMLAMAVFCFFRSPLVSLADAIAHAALADKGERFANIRIWGSVGFALFALLSGQLKSSSHVMLLLMLSGASYLLSAAAAFGVKSPRTAKEPWIFGRTLKQLKEPTMPLLLLATAIYYSGHATFDVYYGLHLKNLHFDDSFVGLAWATGVAVEIALMMVAPRILKNTPSAHLLAFSGIIAALRWYCLSQATSALGLLSIQPLHGVTFGLWYLSLVKTIQDNAPEALRASLQSFVLSAMGLGMMAGYLVGGRIFEFYDGRMLYLAATGSATLAALLYATMAFLQSRLKAQDTGFKGDVQDE